MPRFIRGLAAGLAAAAMLAGTAVTAHADKLDDIDSNSVPPVLDLLIMRPAGLAATAAGALVFVPAGAVTAIFHWESVPTLFDHLVRGPYEFTFKDPIGTHMGDERNY